MKHIIIIFFLVASICYSKNNNYQILSNKNILYNSIDNNYVNRDINLSLKALLYSSLVPGSGQYFVNKNKLKGIMMFGLEIIALYAYDYNETKANNFKKEYQAYGDIKWDFAYWCSNYNNWNDINNEFFEIFSNNETGIYHKISEDSHHLNFWYNNEGINTFVSTSTNDFQDLYDEEGFSNFDNINNFTDNNGFVLEKDHHFYENIVKYNHFFSGWEDSDSIYLIINSNGYKTAFSPNKLTYRNYYDKSVKSYQYRDFFLNVIFINHFISMLDALVVSKILNNNLSLSFDYNSKINFYEANLSINLR